MLSHNQKISIDIFTILIFNIACSYYSAIPIIIRSLPGLIPGKIVYGLFWSTPTFKDTDCNYLLHIFDQQKVDYIISPSSANTVEGMARAIKRYNEEKNKKIRAILLVPEISAFKVARSAIENNSNVKYVVLQNSTLDSTREFAKKLGEKISDNYNYPQVALEQVNLLCLVQELSR